MFSVGLTGGIASGKTTVSDLFADLGVPIIDTDVISRGLLDPGEPAYAQVLEHFGGIRVLGVLQFVANFAERSGVGVKSRGVHASSTRRYRRISQFYVTQRRAYIRPARV